ncbi:MAG: hypothetical protein H7837_11385 [Magnetococcus sp. MYC-9]
MFKILDHYTFVWPITVLVPMGGAQREVGGFDAHFRLLPIDEAAASADVSRGGGDETMLTRILVGWNGIATEDGQDFPFSPDNLKTLAGNPCVRTALFRGYFDAVSGQAREKNWPTPPDTGR